MQHEVPFTAPESEINVETPRPLKWHVLIRPLGALEYTPGGVAMTPETQKQEEFSCQVGQVVALGPMAYNDPKHGPRELNPNVGDWVMYPTYGGTRIEMADGRVFQLMNDDTVTALIENPELYRKKLV